MITFLNGTLVEATPTVAVVEVGGVGYEILIPLSSFDKLPAPGSKLKILTHLAVREDAHILYGFMTEEERELFRLLISSVSGIGPRIAINVLSGIGVAAFRVAVAQGEVKVLSGISGIGKKTAERIVVELKDKVGDSATLSVAPSGKSEARDQQTLKDASAALVSLGFKPIDAQQAVKEVLSVRGGEISTEEIIRLCLKGR